MSGVATRPRVVFVDDDTTIRRLAEMALEDLPIQLIACDGAAAAHRPKAPSTCTHAPAGFARAQMAVRSSHAPVFTLPSCAITMVGPAIAGI